MDREGHLSREKKTFSTIELNQLLQSKSSFSEHRISNTIKLFFYYKDAYPPQGPYTVQPMDQGSINQSQASRNL